MAPLKATSIFIYDKLLDRGRGQGQGGGQPRIRNHCQVYTVITITSVILVLNSINVSALPVPVNMNMNLAKPESEPGLVDPYLSNNINSLQNNLVPRSASDTDNFNSGNLLNHQVKVPVPIVEREPIKLSAKIAENTALGIEISSENKYGSLIIRNFADDQEIKYEVGLTLRCAAMGESTRPNVTWLYYRKPLTDDLVLHSRESYSSDEQDSIISALISSFKNHQNQNPIQNLNSTNTRNSAPENGQNQQKEIATNALRDQPKTVTVTSTSVSTRTTATDKGKITPKKAPTPINWELHKDLINWVDFKLPKLNMALYGEFECQSDGITSKTIYVIHNANSSVFMKLVRTTIATLILLLAVLAYRYCLWYGIQRKAKRYERLSKEDFKTIQLFRQGLTEYSEDTDFSIAQCKSYISTMTAETTLTLTMDDYENGGGGGISSMGINSWVDLDPYDGKKEVLKENFKIDFDRKSQVSQYGCIFTGKIRSPKTMKFEMTSVKVRSSRRHDGTFSPPLDEILKELKILASLPKDHFCIVNLQAAFTQKLYKCEVYLLLDFCENGPLARFMEINRTKFRDLDCSTTTRDNKTLMSNCNGNGNFRLRERDENQNSQNPRIYLFSTEDLIVWAAEIADGMKFLHKQNIVHGNLNTSNVFLTEELIAKVGNIGYAPKVSELQYPPEYRSQTEYSPKSDVWNYGMTLFEIFSLRSQQHDYPNEQDITDHFAQGKLLVQPKYSSGEIQNLMESCWNPEQNSRPEFQQISDNLRQLLQEF